MNYIQYAQQAIPGGILYMTVPSDNTRVDVKEPITPITYLDKEILAEAQRLGISVEEYLKMLKKQLQTGVVYEDSGSSAINYYRSRTTAKPENEKAREAASTERQRLDEAEAKAKANAAHAFETILAPTLPSTWIGLGTGAMDIKTGEAKDTPEGLLWDETRVAQDLLLPVAAAGAYRGIRSSIKLADRLGRRAYAPYDLYRTIGETPVLTTPYLYRIKTSLPENGRYILHDHRSGNNFGYLDLYEDGNQLGTMSYYKNLKDENFIDPDMINSFKPNSKVGEDLYNGAITLSNSSYSNGFRGGAHLMSPEKTIPTYNHFNKLVLDNNGIYEILQQDGSRIRTPGSRYIFKLETRQVPLFERDGDFYKEIYKESPTTQSKIITYSPPTTSSTSKTISFGEVPNLEERAFLPHSNTVYNWDDKVREGLAKARSYYSDGYFSARAASKLDIPWDEADLFSGFAVKHIDDTKVKVDPKLAQYGGIGANATSSIDQVTGLSTLNVNPGVLPNIYTVIHETGGHGATLNYDPTNISGWGFTKQLAPTKETRRVLLKIMDNATNLGLELELKPEFKTWESTYKHYLDLGESEEYARKAANYLHKDPSYGQIGAIDGYYRTGQEGRSYWMAGRLWLIDHGIINLDEVYSKPELLKLLSEIDLRFKLFTPESMKDNYGKMVAIGAPIGIGLPMILLQKKHGGKMNYLNYIQKDS